MERVRNKFDVGSKWLSKELGRRKLLKAGLASAAIIGGLAIYEELNEPQEVEFTELLANPEEFKDKEIRTYGYQGNIYIHKSPTTINFITEAVDISASYNIHSQPIEESPSLEARETFGAYTKGDSMIVLLTGSEDFSSPSRVINGTFTPVRIDGVFKRGGVGPDRIFYFINCENGSGSIKNLEPSPTPKP